MAGTDTVQFIEARACAGVWLKLNGFPAASTAFAPAAPGRPAGLMGGMPATVAAVAAGAPEADGQGAGAAEPAEAGALPLATGAGALPLATGAGALALAAGAAPLALAAGAAWLPLAAGAAPLALAAAETQEPNADCWIVVVLPPEIARMIPRVRPNAIGMARGTAIRAARLLLPRRRHADLCPLSIQSTSMDVRCAAPDASP